MPARDESKQTPSAQSRCPAAQLPSCPVLCVVGGRQELRIYLQPIASYLSRTASRVPGLAVQPLVLNQLGHVLLAAPLCCLPCAFWQSTSQQQYFYLTNQNQAAGRAVRQSGGAVITISCLPQLAHVSAELLTMMQIMLQRECA